jgi:hypothetical protein
VAKKGLSVCVKEQSYRTEEEIFIPDDKHFQILKYEMISLLWKIFTATHLSRSQTTLLHSVYEEAARKYILLPESHII